MQHRSWGIMWAAGAVATVLAAACGSVISTNSTGADGPSAESVEMAELEDAVGTAAAALLDAPAVEIGMVTRVSDDRVRATRWTTYVGDDTYKTIQLRWTDGSELVGSDATVPAGVEIYATVVTDGGGARAFRWANGEGIPWRRQEVPAGSGGQAWQHGGADDLATMASGDLIDATPDLEATVRRSADGTSTWTASWTDDDRTMTYSWTVAAEGHLLEHLRTFATPSEGPVTDHARFELQESSPTITLPTSGAELDVEEFGVWEDLPRPQAS